MFLAKEISNSPRTLLISPEEISIEPGVSIPFTAKVLDDGGKELSGYQVGWEAQGGSIDENGVFHAGQEKGEFKIVASVGDLRLSARVIVNEAPPVSELIRLVIAPQDAIISPGESLTFSVRGFDRDNQEVPVGQVTWKATGGIIDDHGNFTADDKEGAFLIRAIAGEISGTASFNVHGREANWEGEIPYQK
jgi:hypothetical protein